MKKQKISKNAGFTLVEVIVVIVIIAILAAIAVPALTGYIERSKEKAAVLEARQVVQALQTIAVDPIASEGYEFQVGAGGHGGGKPVYGNDDNVPKLPTWADVISELVGKEIKPNYITQIRFTNNKGAKLRQVRVTTGSSGNFMYIFYLEGKYYKVPDSFDSKNPEEIAALGTPIVG